jgi:hypothetical protein
MKVVSARDSLGFYAAGEADDRWHALKVTVTRRGVKLRHRECCLAAATAVDVTQNWEAARWREVAYNPLGSRGDLSGRAM